MSGLLIGLKSGGFVRVGIQVSGPYVPTLICNHATAGREPHSVWNPQKLRTQSEGILNACCGRRQREAGWVEDWCWQVIVGALEISSI